MNTRLLTAAVMLAMGPALPAQDLKPAKDKDSKLFGYQNSAKEWVIKPSFDKADKFSQGVAVVKVDGMEGVIDAEGNYLFEPQFTKVPSFDKDGHSIVMLKDNKQKYHAVINTAGEVIIPLECLSIKKDAKRAVFHAERIFDVENPSLYNSPTACAWGVYDFNGDEIFAPCFSEHPVFAGDGTASACDKASHLCGIISADGRVLLPFEYHYAYKTPKGYKALDQSLKVVDISEDGSTVIVDPTVPSAPWMPVPYSCGGDMVKGFAYGHHMIGRKVYKNSIWLADVKADPAHNRAQLMTSSALMPSGNLVTWDRRYTDFMRLELEEDDVNGSFEYDKTGAKYTVCLKHYDLNGGLIETVSRWGSIVADSVQGVLYEAEGRMLYFISYDINWPDEQMAVVLEGYHAVDVTSLVDELGLDMNAVNAMSDYWASQNIFNDVDLAERSGYQSYIPYGGPSVLSDGARLISMLEERFPFLVKKYYADHVYTMLKASHSATVTSVAVAPGYVAAYHDDYGHSFKLTLEEPVFWGVRADRYLRIFVEPFTISSSDMEHPEKVPGMVNDLDGKTLAVRFIFALFEEDGTFVRIVGSADKLSYAADDVFAFDGAGIMFSRRRPDRGEIKFPDTRPCTGRISDFKNVNY